MNWPLQVAVPWSLSHYIPLNGFHPLYRALFEEKPNWVKLAAWDNIELSHKLRGDHCFQSEILSEVKRDSESQNQLRADIEKEYFSHFWAPNRALTRLLPGDIEFHHTAPFPSLERPFVFHCESFAPVFFPFAYQGTGNLSASQVLRAYYKAIFEHPFCLGISSHLPQTIEDISRFFASPLIDKRLFTSRVGLRAAKEAPGQFTKGSLNAPVFLFINSANQNPGNFFLRGGHLALRYWQVSHVEPGAGRLIMGCARPIDALLAEHGVDINLLKRQERHSVIWIEDYLSAADLDALMQAAHFLLLPSALLDSVSIMQAMASGAVPVVSDTFGTDRYVTDAVDGIVLQGVCASNWKRDAETGVRIDNCQRNHELDTLLVQQLVARLSDLLTNLECYSSVQAAAVSKATAEFCGKAFSDDFWGQVRKRYQGLPETLKLSRDCKNNGVEFADCLLEQSDWTRIFTSAPQPVERLNAGQGRVIELGGCFVAVPGNYSMNLHNWSPLAEYVDRSAPPLIFAADLKGLDGRYLGCPISAPGGLVRRRFVECVAERLMPYPKLYSKAAGLIKHLRRLYRVLQCYLPSGAVATKPVVVTPLACIELVEQDVKGFNLIRHGDVFYAIPLSDGAFDVARAQAGQYSRMHTGNTPEEVRDAIYGSVS